MRRRWIKTIVVIAIAVSLAAAAAAYAGRWEMVKRQIDREFPDVKKITTAELAELLRAKRNGVPLLLDVRTKAEYKVSHLQGARSVEPGSDPRNLPLPASKDEPIVTYCSVGYRSAQFARKLAAAGFSNVRNLEGSIFQWANEGRPVMRDGLIFAKVHPYNKVWGTLLRKELRANTAASPSR